VVIGGGVVGCSVALSPDEGRLDRRGAAGTLGADLGSTWHAAGGMHTINGDPNVAALQKYTVELYKEIEELSGQDIGLHMTGGVMLAATPERFDWLKSIRAKGRYMGLEAELITPKEAHELFPAAGPDQFVGAML
jgi:dimethylglycine dehydrogenase